MLNDQGIPALQPPAAAGGRRPGRPGETQARHGVDRRFGRARFPGFVVPGRRRRRHTPLLADDDQLHVTNLQRQILYRSADTATGKAALAQRHLQALNPLVESIPLAQRHRGKGCATRSPAPIWCWTAATIWRPVMRSMPPASPPPSC